MKTVEMARAREMRAIDGGSVTEIARALDVSPSSVSRWVRDVGLTADQERALDQRGRRMRHSIARHRAAEARRRRATWQEEGRLCARLGEPLHRSGCMLYWAEGSRSRNSIIFTNSDPQMVRFFLEFLIRSLGVSPERVRVDLNLFSDHVHEQHEIERHWLSILGLPPTCLRKSTVNAYSRYSQRKRMNRLPYGTCRIAVHSTPAVQHVFGAIQEYGGFARPDWLE